MNDREAYRIFNALPGMTFSRVRALVEAYESVSQALSSVRSFSREEAETWGIRPNTLAKIQAFDQEGFLRREDRLMKNQGIRAVCLADADFPERLKTIPDPPLVLYGQGVWPESGEAAVAFVGRRQASLYGLGVARSWSAALAEKGFLIVSGCARGIDAAAHQGALDAGGLTIAVMGCGLAHHYPETTAPLREKIVKSGCVLSEFPLEEPPRAFHFPRRNRIVSGLSLGVVVVEASRRSGALITSRCALEQGREVFAVPGPVTQPGSWGPHQLIRQGAIPVSSPGEILSELALPLVLTRSEEPEDVSSASHQPAEEKKEHPLLKILGRDGMTIEELLAQVPEPAELTLSAITQLELQHRIQRQPGNRIVRREG